MLRKLFFFRKYTNVEVGLFKGIKNLRDVNEYLINRSRPAKEILSNLLPEDKITLEDIKSEYISIITNNGEAPSKLKDENYLNLLCMSKAQRHKHLRFLYIKEMYNNNSYNDENKSESSKNLGCLNNFFDKKSLVTKIRKVDRLKMVRSKIMNNQKLIFDMAFERDMDMKSISSLVRQIKLVYSENKSSEEPYQIIFTEVNKQGVFYTQLYEQFNQPNVNLESTMMEFYEESYLDLFPNDKFIYLSPNARRSLENEYDHDTTFILGGYVDSGDAKPFTLMKSHKQGLMNRSLPLPKLKGTAKKELTLDIMLKILHQSQENGGNWSQACKNAVPLRFKAI